MKPYTVFVPPDVPKLEQNPPDSVHPFNTLIGPVLHHPPLVVLFATPPPADLYRGDFNVKAFERTASRLVEMQSREYRETGK